MKSFFLKYQTYEKILKINIIFNTEPVPLSTFFLINLFILFAYFWLCWVFVAVHGLSLVAVSRGYSSLLCAGFSLRWLLLLLSTGSRHVGFSSCGTRAQQLWLTGSRAQAQQLWHTGPVASGIFPDQGSEPCPPQWQADSQPLHHQESPPLSTNSFWCLGSQRPCSARPSIYHRKREHKEIAAVLKSNLSS